MVRLLDPTYDEPAPRGDLAPRPTSLKGATVGVISNGKAGTKPFFDELERLLHERWEVAEVTRVTKSNYSAPAGAELLAETAGWAVMFAGVGD
jgi:hypothetical protein